MKFVTSRVKINVPKIKQLDRASITALEKTLSALHTEVVKAQVMPLNTATPYARRMYFHPEYNFQTKENANARGNWYEPWISGKEKDFCSKAFSQFYKKEAGL